MENIEIIKTKAFKEFRKLFRKDPELAAIAPGRTNLIGEHTDYNDGHVLPVAIDRFTIAVCSPREDRICSLHTLNMNESFELNLDNSLEELPRWVAYIVGVLMEFERAGYKLFGVDLLVYGDIPLGSGISSSAALEVSVATVLERLAGLQLSDEELVLICRKADHNFVGIMSGPMDQIASRSCKKGFAGLLDCRSLKLEHYPLPKDVDFLSVYSGIPRSLADSGYNERLLSCRRAVSVLCQLDDSILALRDATLEMVESCRAKMKDVDFRRARHVVNEQKRVFKLIDAMSSGDLQAISQILHEGHFSLSEDYEVSLPVLDDMVNWLKEQPGIIGTRLTGAGFGGSLLSMAKANSLDVAELEKQFIKRFENRTEKKPEIWKLISVDGAQYIDSFK